MTFTIPDWLAENIAWVVVGTGGVGFGTYLLKRRGGSMAKRMDDKVLEQMMRIVQDNTAAFTALKGVVEDNKGITISVANTLGEVQKSFAALVQKLNDGDVGRAAHLRQRHGT